MRIALFGGSFNPIHNGHLEIAEKLLKEKFVDQVWIIPCGKHAFGKELASGKDRVNMIRLAIENHPSIEIIGVELNLDKKSYTSKTVAWFKKEFKNEFYFVIGEDNLKDLDKWNDFNYLKNNLEFILIKRKGSKLSNNLGIKIKEILKINTETSSTEIKENLKKGLSIRGLVPKKVEKYISQRKLYHE